MNKSKNPLKGKVKVINRSLYGLIGVAVFACIYLLNRPGINKSLAAATTVKQEKFTELYFENHTKLPKLVEFGKHYSFIFTIHNSTNYDNNYTYSVYYYFNGVKYYIENNHVFVKENGYKSIQEIFMPTPTMPRVEMVVDLIPSNQKIGFWITLLR